MISVILIGKNEGWRLKKSLDSVYNLIDTYPEIDFEVIYVDSKSTDGSVELACTFKGIRVFEITGNANAAVARNIGAQESNGEVLFFIDADMEIDKNFLGHALDKGCLKHECLTGHVDDYFYNMKGEFLGNKPRTYKGKIPKSTEILKTTGGLIFVTKKAWDKIGGMRTKYKRSQDLDFCLRLNEIGVHVYRLPFFLARHNTIDYSHEDRMWNNIKSGYFFYPPMLFRDHLTSYRNILKTIRSNFSAFILLFVLFSMFISPKIFIYLFVFYFSIIFYRVCYKQKKMSPSDIRAIYSFERTMIQFLTDLFFWIGFFCFYPKDKTIEYRENYNIINN